MTEQQIEKERTDFEAWHRQWVLEVPVHQAQSTKMLAAFRAGRASASHEPAGSPSPDAAYEMGAKGGPIVEAERLGFEAWMRGHCWALCATWNGRQYVSEAEQGGDVDPRAMRTRQLWAVWRDRAALAAAPEQAATACAWALEDDDSGAWATSCGEKHLINDGTPAENGMRFCCYCGLAATAGEVE